MKVLAIGASKNIGYWATTNLLKGGHSVVYFMRSPKAFDSDPTIGPYLQSGAATIVKGDALNKPDVENAWKAANKDGQVDMILFTVGGLLKFELTKGFSIDPPNLTTQALSNVLQTIAPEALERPIRLIAVSSTGITKESHDKLPFGLKSFYSYALHSPHADKLGLERLLQWAMGKQWKEGVEPSETVLSPDWQKSYPPIGWLPNLVVVRPAFLTDGEAKGQYKVSTDEFSSYTVSRKDMGHFIGVRLVEEWDMWRGKIVNVGN